MTRNSLQERCSKAPARPPAFRFGILSVAFGWVLGVIAASAVGAEPAGNPAGPAERAVREAALPYQILEPLAVQDFGFEKTFLSFAQERLGLIARRAHLSVEHPIAVVLGMVFEPTQWQSKPLFKIDHPDLVQIFGNRKIISAADFTSEGNMQRVRRLVESKPSAESAVDDLGRRVQALLEVGDQLAIVPRSQGEWLTPDAVGKSAGTISPTYRAIVKAYAALRDAFLKRDPAAFASAAGELVKLNRDAAQATGMVPWRLRVDLLNTRLQPFFWSAVIYLLATLVYVAALALGGGRRLATAAFLLMVVGLVAQVTGLTFRTLLVGRAPMSNMYESLVFAVGGMVALAAILDRVYKNALVGLAGALLGFIFLVIAVKMPVHQSRLNQLMPALQSSWLTYHVTTVMLSYSAFALSFFLSLTYLIKNAAGGAQAKLRILQALPSLEALDFFNYRIIAVGFPLLTVGIFTGAVWAATAWGRPWAFDPKETWSAITWLIYGVYLHTRLLGGWKGARSAVLALVGFLAVLFTYLGVNFLLPGLHSYV